MLASVNGTRIYFDVDGSALVPDGQRMKDRPVAFLSHGGPGGDHTSFKPGYSPLAQDMQLVYYDHRGHGRSARGDESTYTLDQNAEDLEGLREYLGLGPIVSIGGSYGGMVAMAHAARHPASVSHLVLVVTAAHGGYHERSQQILEERGTLEQGGRLWAGKLRTADDMKKYYEVMGSLYSTTHDPLKAAEGVERATHEPAPITSAFKPGGFLRTFDLRPELSQITAPTLVIGGRHDWMCAPEFSEEITGLIPDAQLQIFENSGHSVRADEPERLLDAIRSFVEA
jgi:proline iminopeptidase